MRDFSHCSTSTSSHVPFLDLVHDIKRCSKILDDNLCMALVVVSEENWQFFGAAKGQQNLINSSRIKCAGNLFNLC